jgi:hypothetical protein
MCGATLRNGGAARTVMLRTDGHMPLRQVPPEMAYLREAQVRLTKKSPCSRLMVTLTDPSDVLAG